MSATSRLSWPVAALLAATTIARVAQAEATFVINVLDAPGVGFSDNTPATPVGGNTGTTVGQQRLIVFQAAADAWGRVLESPVSIVVEASFAPLACAANSAVAGQAAPYSIDNYPGLPTTGAYPLALANRLLGRDLFPDSADISAQFNGALMACIGSDWYYGLDGKGSANQSDLLSTVMHELTHGLGFTSDMDPDTGEFSTEFPPVFANYVLDTSSGKHWPEMSDAERKSSLIDVRKLVWDGNRVQAVAAWELAKGLPSVQVAPSPSGFSGIIGEANFGRLVADGPTITGQVAAATISASCSLGATSFGKIALVTSPASCASLGAAAIVEHSGGLAMLFAYDEAGTPPPVALEARADEMAQFPVTIPTLALTRDDANLVRNASATVTLSADKNRQVGADSAGHTLLFASNPVQPGSTGAHWDPLVRPNLLLEPVSSPIPVTDLVMERALLWDIGWTGTCGNGSVDGQEECDNGAANSDRTPDACRLDCKKPKCGDGVVDSGEQCDPGSSGVGSAPDPNCPSDCGLITPPATGGASGSGGSSASGGAGGWSGGATARSGGAGGSGGSSAGGGAGGKNGGATARSGGAGGTSTSASTKNPGGKSGGCSFDTAHDSSASGFWLVAFGLALMLGRRRRDAT
jgi:hypothetical protein